MWIDRADDRREQLTPAVPGKTVVVLPLGQFLRAGGLTLDRFERTVTLPIALGNPGERAEAQTIELSGIEFKLLHALMSSPKEAISRSFLLLVVWKVDWPIQSNRVEVAINQLRRKLGQNKPGAKFIVSVHGKGYRLGTGCVCWGCANGRPCEHPGALGHSGAGMQGN
jgi:DNA-binding response OmpR family regulator